MTTLGMLGVGNWGKNLLRDFAQMPDVRVAAVCDHEPKRLKVWERICPGARLTGESSEVFGDPAIEAVVIATPAVMHYELAKAALEAGKHVFVEKPLTLKVEHAVELIELARRAGRVLMVGHLLRYHPAIAKLRGMIDAGELGEVYYIYTQRVNLGSIRSDENALWSFAPHDISVILYLLGGLPDRVSARGECYIQPGIEDVVFVTMHFADRKMASIHLSWLDPHKIRKFTIVGSKKMVTFDDMEPTEKIRIYDKGFSKGYDSYGDWITVRFGDITIPRIDMAEPLKLECQHFLECVKTGKEPVTNGEDGLRVLRVLDAAQRSLDQGGVPVDLAAATV